MPSPPFPFSHPTVNMEIVFVSLCVYTRARIAYLYVRLLCGDLLMSVFLYCTECKLAPCSLRGCGGCRRVRWPLQRKLHRPPSINTLLPVLLRYRQSIICRHTLVLSLDCSLSSFWRHSQTFITTITVSCHYPFEWEGGGCPHRLSCSHNNSTFRLKRARWAEGKYFILNCSKTHRNSSFVITGFQWS